MKSWRTAQKIKNTCHHGTYFYHYLVAYGLMTARFHTLHNQVQTSNKAHDKFVPRRDCACADHLRPSLSTALLSGWSSHLVLIGFRLTFPLSQARTPWTRQARLRSPKACVRAHERSASHLVLSSFILTKSFVKMPATFFSINSFASFSSSIVQMR